MNNPQPKRANRLAGQPSPYLQQHAYNPVDWFPWGDEAWNKAKQENKLVLVSIGYSACHWCHVMERESFEDEAVAKVMNEKFICIKVDREERPDVDQVYMTAVQIMTGSGGWPLNCFTLPDGRPVYGGTYFPKSNWLNVLNTLAGLFSADPARVQQYAQELTAAVKGVDLLPEVPEETAFTKNILNECVENWRKRFDNEEGGPKKAPKFPLPNNYQFLLRQHYFTKDESLLKHIRLTLDKMAMGGIYDHLGGGFARYSTDGEWKVPHFEKMLYDNAQLVSLYSEAYRLEKDPLYRQVVYETLEFVSRELTSPEGAFYSALDADSEGEEGKYYTWTKDELQEILGNDFGLFSDYFSVNDAGEWEGKYILLRKDPEWKIAKKFTMEPEEFSKKISALKKNVISVREKRIRPGLDNKILTSWNALMIKGYADAYSVFHEPAFLDAALKCGVYLFSRLSKEDGGLLHTHGINGFLEDYSFSAEAFLALYQTTGDEQWLQRSRSLTEYCLRHFRDNASGMFFFTSALDAPLIARKIELQDNVIPSSNSSLAKVLFCLGKYFDEELYSQIAEKMLKQVLYEIPKYGSAYSNWAILLQHFVYPFYEIAIVGNSVDEKQKELSGHFIPNAIFAPGKGQSTLPLLQNRFAEGKTFIYICKNKTCKLPVENITDALQQLE